MSLRQCANTRLIYSRQVCETVGVLQLCTLRPCTSLRVYHCARVSSLTACNVYTQGALIGVLRRDVQRQGWRESAGALDVSLRGSSCTVLIRLTLLDRL